MNKTILKGNLVADPESKTVGANNTPLTKFRLAINEYKKTVFVDVETWEKTAENCAKFLNKGSPILVDGRLALDEWESEGKKRSRIFVVANSVEFLGKLNSEDAKSGASSESPPQKTTDEDDVPF
jgi:single-strand DNA-binding protein